MLRRLSLTAAGGVLVLVGSYIFLHNAFGFVLPQITFNLPQVDWAEVAAVIAGSPALVSWNLVWPAVVVILGLLLLFRGSRARVGSR